MPLDGARAEEQLLPDLWIGASLAREVSDLFFLRRQVCAAWCGSTLRFLSGSLQLTSGLFGERGSAHRSEIRVRQSQLLACGCLLVGPAKPSAVAKARAPGESPCASRSGVRWPPDSSRRSSRRLK